MATYLLMVLEAPAMTFGREAVDARGPVSDFPGASLLTGLLANALGWRREERGRHARLQARLRFAARLDRDPARWLEGRSDPGMPRADRMAARLTDFQTVRLNRDDRGWTTRGAPEGRAGGADTYKSPHIRYRQFDADARVALALHLDPAEEAPDVAALAAALDCPARPLFIGRKPCLPSRPLLAGTVQAEGLLEALDAVPPGEDPEPVPRILLPPAEAGGVGEEVLVADLRDWRSGVHGGQRAMRVIRRATGGAP
jgi:CRISPR system Cascade subunit CasD